MIYCFASQLRAVQTHYPDHRIRPIVTPSDIKGLEMQTFVSVTPVGVRFLVPQALIEALKERGFILITINEQYSRDFFRSKKQ